MSISINLEMQPVNEMAEVPVSNGKNQEDSKVESNSSDQVKGSIKYGKIKEAIALNDLVALRALALDRGGLLKDELRRKAWPILLKINQESPLEMPSEETINAHTYNEQVNMVAILFLSYRRIIKMMVIKIIMRQ